MLFISNGLCCVPTMEWSPAALNVRAEASCIETLIHYLFDVR